VLSDHCLASDCLACDCLRLLGRGRLLAAAFRSAQLTLREAVLSPKWPTKRPTLQPNGRRSLPANKVTFGPKLRPLQSLSSSQSVLLAADTPDTLSGSLQSEQTQSRSVCLQQEVSTSKSIFLVGHFFFLVEEKIQWKIQWAEVKGAKRREEARLVRAWEPGGRGQRAVSCVRVCVAN